MNSNLIHNVLNLMIGISGAITVLLISTGCVDAATGLDCSGSFLPPEYTASACAVMGLMKSVINLARDGVAGLYKPQPPVKK